MTDSPHIVQLDETNFMEVVVEGSDRTPILVDFWADWCGPCKSLMPILEKLAVEYNGAFVLAKLDTEAHPGIAQQLGIRSLPTVKLFRNRQLVDEFMGALPEADVRTFLEAHVEAPLAGGDGNESGGNPVIEQALRLQAQGDGEKARALLQEAQANDPENTDILLALGQVCASQGDLDTAASCLKALPEDQRNGLPARKLAGTLELAGEADGSRDVAELAAALESDPTDSEARYQLAIGTALQGNFQGAMDHLLQLVQRDPQFRDEAPRRKLLAVFDILGNDPLAGQYRRKLFALLH